MIRIQVLLDPGEKETFRRLAQERGLSLSAWLRQAALLRSAEESRASRLRSTAALRAFFAECDARELGREPDWSEHVDVLESSKREGTGAPAPDARGRKEPRARGAHGEAPAALPRKSAARDAKKR